MRTTKDSTASEPANPAAQQDARELIGRVIDGRYKIVELIGQGGMGNVYRAEHVTIRRPVALKFLLPELAKLQGVRRRFEREAYAIGRIKHPNCVNVSDFGELGDGSLYLAMELLDGQSLGDVLYRDHQIEPRRALHIIRHVLRGLGHAHAAGIVHRDVKPENVVLVEHDGDPDFAKILDFGIAKLIGVAETSEGDDKLTQAGVAFGTPIYLSPEQAIGEPANPPSDLYSVAVMLFEMISGRPPFFADDKLEILAMHTTRAPPALSAVAEGVVVPLSLDKLLARGLAKRPAERFSSAEEFIAAIDLVVPSGSAGTPMPRPFDHTETPMPFPVVPSSRSGHRIDG